MIISKRIEGRLTKVEDITGKLVLIEGSNTDYINQFGEVYKIYDKVNKLYLKKKHYRNNHNGYIYIGITFSDGINRSRRLHVLLAKAHLTNPNPISYNIVGHKNNDKSDYDINNLYWTNTSENTKKAFDDGLAKNDKGYDDSQSISICYFNMSGELLGEYGSMILAHKELNVSVSTIGRQCRHETITHPRCGYYFRTKEEYDKVGFIK